jgi:hypothetical protein
MQCLKRHSATEGVPCVRGVLDQCFDEHSIINEIMCSDIPPNHSSDSKYVYTRDVCIHAGWHVDGILYVRLIRACSLLLQSFGGNALKATAHFMGDQSLDTDFAVCSSHPMHRVYAWVFHNPSQALWLGELGHSEGWIDFPESSVFRTLERTIRHSLDRWHPTQVNCIIAYMESSLINRTLQLDESCRHSCHPFSDEYHPNEASSNVFDTS